jgi:hypothetical protein
VPATPVRRPGSYTDFWRLPFNPAPFSQRAPPVA